MLDSSVLPDSSSAKLDLELLYMHVLQVSRAQLYAQTDWALNAEQQQYFQKLLVRRQRGEPMAYILGHRAFWNLELQVNSDVLIPRPETEILVESALALSLPAQAKVLDLGTGSGAIALALAIERPNWKVFAVDKSAAALRVAQANAEKNAIRNVGFTQSDWFIELNARDFDLIVSNPPYVADNDVHLKQGDLRFEPLSALVSGAEGLDDFCKIIGQSSAYLKVGAYLLLEHAPWQTTHIGQLLSKNKFSQRTVYKDLAGLERVTQACHANN